MYDLGGPLRLAGDPEKGDQVENGSALDLRDVGVVRRTDQGVVEAAWVGDLPSGESVRLRFAPTDKGRQLPADWFEGERDEVEVVAASADVKIGQEVIASVKEGERFSVRRREGDLLEITVDSASGRRSGWAPASAVRSVDDSSGGRSRRLAGLAAERLRLNQGDVRLVGWTDDELTGLAITPQASQQTRTTLVLAHLRRCPLSPPQVDLNMRLDVETIIRDETDDANWGGPPPTQE
jgi:hypothetical protein